MRVLPALALCGFALSPITAYASEELGVPTPLLLGLARTADDACRGGSGDNRETFAWCSTREALGEVLEVRGGYYGREGEAGNQMNWHRCGPGSIHKRLND